MSSRPRKEVTRQVTDQPSRCRECSRGAADPCVPVDVRLASAMVVRTAVGAVRRTLDVHRCTRSQLNYVVPLPAANYVVERDRHALPQHPATAEGQIVYRGGAKKLALIVVRAASLVLQQRCSAGPGENSVGPSRQYVRGIVECVSPRVRNVRLEPRGHSASQLGLQAVVASAADILIGVDRAHTVGVDGSSNREPAG